MKSLVCTVLVCLAFAQTVFSQKSTPSPEKVKELMQLTGAANLGIQTMRNMIVEFRKLAPNVDSTFWNDFMNEVDVDEMENMVIPIYQQHFTSGDVDGLIAFLQIAAGPQDGEQASRDHAGMLQDRAAVRRKARQNRSGAAEGQRRGP